MGFEKVILKEGTGSFPTKGKNVTVHCTGYGKNGDMSLKFWSTKGYLMITIYLIIYTIQNHSIK